MPNIDLSILNQRQTPAFYASSLATRPAFGFAGRMFIDTDVPSTGIYRDTGSAWVQIADQTGSLTGYIQTQSKWTTASNQRDFLYGLQRFIVANDNPATAGTVPLNTLFINYQNDFTVGTVITGSVGINTSVPTATFDVHSGVNVIQQLNQTVATNNSLLAFQNNNAGLWRVGNFYNAGANDFGVFDVIGAIQPVTIKNTTGQVLIGTPTVGSGKLVVASSTGDNGVQIVGASAPSLRIDNAESGPTKRAGLGISTATNNFIQGSADRDFCIFNGSTTASPILFGIYGTTNVQEAARISAAQNFILGSVIDSGQKLQVTGTAYISSNVGIGTNNPASLLNLLGAKPNLLSTDTGILNIDDSTAFATGVGGSIVLRGNYRAIGDKVGAAAIAASKVNSTDGDFGFNMLFYTRQNGNPLSVKMNIKSNGIINLSNVPSTSAGLVSGDIYQTAGVLNIVP